MATITVSLPSDGDTVDVADYNTPITTIVNEFNGSIDNSNIKAAAAIAGSKIAGGTSGIGNANLVTTAGDVGGAWKAWTPTLSGLFADAKWTKACYYTQIGKTVHFRVKLTANNTTPMSGSGDAVISLPVTALDYTVVDYSGIIGAGGLFDASGALFNSYIVLLTTTTAAVRLISVSGSYTAQVAATSAVPMTWTTNDVIVIHGTYEVA